jgi:hypothetical protein
MRRGERRRAAFALSAGWASEAAPAAFEEFENMPRRFLLFIVLLLCGPALAHDYEKGGIHIADPWTPAPIGMAKVMAGYFEIISMKETPDRLVGARSAQADRVELHGHSEVDGVMRMRPVEAVEINPFGGAELEPGGLHLMIMGLTQKVEAGDRIPVTLIFEHAGEIEVKLTVKPRE